VVVGSGPRDGLYLSIENFVLPFSHDEVVHGKQSMLDKMLGDAWQKSAGLRLLYSFMYGYPGKKLLFMGCEFGQGREWNFAEELDWYLLEREQHLGLQRLVKDLNRLHRELPPLYDLDFDGSGFEWIDCNDNSQSVLSFLRKDGEGRVVAAVFNFTPVPREGYRIGVPAPGFYREAMNSDAEVYSGTNVGNNGGMESEEVPWMNREHSGLRNLPPLGGLILVHEPVAAEEQEPVAKEEVPKETATPESASPPDE
jgi:1,4-alpha-glucan branching enzyme